MFFSNFNLTVCENQNYILMDSLIDSILSIFKYYLSLLFSSQNNSKTKKSCVVVFYRY